MALCFSVAVAFWKNEEWLPGAIECVLGQTHQDWELVIGDNASTADIASIVRRYTDPRIRYQRWSTHIGASENHNRTIALCRNEWVLVFGADDRYRPNCLERIAARIEEVRPRTQRLAMIVTACRRVDPSGELYEMVGESESKRGRRRQSWIKHTPDGLYTAQKWLLANAAPGVPSWMIGSAAMSRELLMEIGAFRPDMGLSHDWELSLRISAYGDVAYIDEPLFDYTHRPDSLTNRLLTRPEAREAEMADISAAWLAVLRAHEERRSVSPAERAAPFDAVGRSFL